MKNLAMLSPLGQMKSEILDLLVSYHFYIGESEKLTHEDPGGLEALRMMVVCQALLQDIILRLPKLGDLRKDVWSFKELRKEREKRGIKISKSLRGKLTQYQNEINQLNKFHRNSYMAHRAKNRQWPPDSMSQIKQVIILALKIADELEGERIDYKIDKSWANSEVDLRAEI